MTGKKTIKITQVSIAMLCILLWPCLYSFQSKFKIGLMLIFFFGVMFFVIVGIKKGLTFTIIDFSWLCTAVYILFDNGFLENGIISYPLYFFGMVVFLIVAKKIYGWENKSVDILLLFFKIYAIATPICMAFPSLYAKIVSLLFSELRVSTLYSTAGRAGLTRHYSVNGIYASFLCIIFYAKWLTSSKNKKNKNLFYLFLSVLVLILIGKRGPMLALAVSFLVSFYYYNVDKKKNRLYKILAIILIVWLVLYIANLFIPAVAYTLSRFSSLLDEDSSLSGRTEIWSLLIMLFNNNKLFGIGWQNFVYVQKNFIGDLSQPHQSHNIYLQMLCELGIVGTCVMMSSLLISLVETIRYLIKMILSDYKDSIFWMVLSLLIQCYIVVYGLSGAVLDDITTLVPYLLSIAIANKYIYLFRMEGE